MTDYIINPDSNRLKQLATTIECCRLAVSLKAPFAVVLRFVTLIPFLVGLLFGRHVVESYHWIINLSLCNFY